MNARWLRTLSSPQGIALLGVIAALLVVSWSTPAKTQDVPPATVQAASTGQAATLTSGTAEAVTATQAATPAQSLSYDHPVTGEISDADPAQSWPFVVNGSDRISLSVMRTDGTLFPKISLLDAQGHVLATADHDPSGAKAAMNRVVLPAAGTYSIVVGRDGDNTGKTDGHYQLTATLLGSGPDTPGLFDNLIPLNLYFSAAGTLSNKKWVDRWQIVVNSSLHLVLGIKRIDGNLIPTVALIGPDNRVVGAADADSTQSAGTLDVMITTPGRYILQIARANGADGETTGSYFTFPVVISWGPDADIYGMVEGQLQLDTVRQGNLNTERWQDTWQVTLAGATTLTITANRCSGTLIPQVALLDGSRKPLVSAQPDDTMTVATIDHYQVTNAGTYFVVVSRLDGMSGLTSGNYSLLVSSAAGGHTQPACSNG